MRTKRKASKEQGKNKSSILKAKPLDKDTANQADLSRLENEGGSSLEQFPSKFKDVTPL